MATNSLPLPPKVAAALAERARTLDGCQRTTPTSGCWLFPIGKTSIVATLIGPLDNPSGTQVKDRQLADKLRHEIQLAVAAKAKAPA